MTRPLAPLSHERLRQLLDRFGALRAVVVGDLMLDRYLIGDVERISPEAPVPVVTVDEEQRRPGGAANVAANVAAIGAAVTTVGVIGDDAAAEELVAALAEFEIGSSALVTAPGRRTTTKTRIMARGQQVVRIDSEMTNPLADPARSAVADAALGALEQADLLLIEDYDKGVLDPELIGQLINRATERHLPVVVDPKARHFFDCRGATLFKPNRRELDQAFGRQLSAETGDLAEARARLGVENLLVTAGADGLILVSEDGTSQHAASIAREVYDVSGAGDTVAAWAGLALAAGATAAEAAWLANLAAGVEVGKQGTATVSPTEVLAAWQDTVGQ